MSLEPYPEYKDSRIDRLGHVPRHWKITRLKNSILEAKNGVWGLEPDGSELDLRCVRVADFDRPRLSIHDRNATLRKIPLSEQKGRILEKGDLLLEKSGGGEKSPVGFVVLYDRDEPAVCSNFVSRLVIQPGMDSRFWTYVHSMLYSRRLTQRSIKQTTGIQNLDQASYFDELVTFPTDEEQRMIADFLDRETAEIDAFIADQEQLIELLEERRTATITHAVTKGLNPNAPMKDSGIEWIGSVPRHWETRRIKSFVSTPVTDGPHETPEILSTGIPFVSAEAVSSGTLNFEKIRGYISKEDNLRFSMKYIPQLHDIYMVKSGATTGVCTIVDTDIQFNIWSPLAAIRCNEDTSPHFVLHALRSRNFQESVRLFWNYGTQQNIGMKVLENLPVPYPDLSEQIFIAEYLDRETVEFDAAVGDAREAIALSRERRGALISAAVTGQIDVSQSHRPVAEVSQEVRV